MKKPELIEGLKQFCANPDKLRRPGQRMLALFFADWLEQLDIPQKPDYLDIDFHVPQLAMDAFENLRTGTDELAVKYRQIYEAETEMTVPNITELGADSLGNQISATMRIISMMREVMDSKWVEGAIDTYANAQVHALELYFDKFLRLVFRRGLYDVIRRGGFAEMKGTFKETELSTFSADGQFLLVFAKRMPSQAIFKGQGGADATRQPNRKVSVSCVGDTDDPLALKAYVCFVEASLAEAMAMIEDVINNWPTTPDEQAKIFRAYEVPGVI